MPWPCPACTFDNPDTAAACDICGKSRPAPAAPAAPAASAAASAASAAAGTAADAALPRVLSLHCAVRSSDETDRPGGNVVDGTESEWWTPRTTAWLEVDLGETCHITGVRIQWWGTSVASTFTLSSSGEGEDGTGEVFDGVSQRTQLDATGPSETYNGWSDVAGWDLPTRVVRLDMGEGSEDPWGKGMMFGVRQVVITGSSGAAAATSFVRAGKGRWWRLLRRRRIGEMDVQRPCEAASAVKEMNVWRE